MLQENIDNKIIKYIVRARDNVLRSQELTYFNFHEGDLLRIAKMIQIEEHRESGIDEFTKTRIKQWILENHDHHAEDETTLRTDCVDGDSPYVNSKDLEDFIESL